MPEISEKRNYINPGICIKETVMTVEKRLFREVALFIGDINGKVADIGCENAKSIYISKLFDVEIDQMDCDFNFESLPVNKYDTILCLEVLEHLQNPLFFMKNLKLMLRKNGTIYLSMPARPQILWTRHHFFEMGRKHFNKWILEPLELRIVRYKKIMLWRAFWTYFTGFRPFLRLFFNYGFIYEIHK